MKKWILVVHTRCTDPSQEKDFNDWYDNVDVPDVLSIPGYIKAARYEGVKMAEYPEDSLKESDPKFLALYHIEIEDINQAIQDLREVSKRMDEEGRGSPLLIVEEAASYHEIMPPYEKALAKQKPEIEKPSWLYVVQGVCADPSREKEFNDWYNSLHVPDIMEAPGFLRATRYELATVLRHDKARGEMPKFLAIYEIGTNDIEKTIGNMYAICKKLRPQSLSPLFKESGSTVYRKIFPH